MNQPAPNLISKCCGAHVTVVGRTTLYYVCLKCVQACDAVPAKLDSPIPALENEKLSECAPRASLKRMVGEPIL